MKETLEQARSKIEDADRKIAELFEERMTAVKSVAEYKKTHGIPIFDSAQEQIVLKRNSDYITDSKLKAYFIELTEKMTELSRKYQSRLNSGMSVAYSGSEGAFAQIAARHIFPEAQMRSYHSFDEAYNAVAIGECDCAVLPIENSYAGEVGAVMDLMYNGDLYVTGIYSLPITQNLLAKGKDIDIIKTVISHPQALTQCEKYINRHGFKTLKCESTATAAQLVAESDDDTVAAIASSETADVYGLNILDRGINESNVNTTRFAVFSKADSSNENDRNTLIFMFTVNDSAGTLARAINVISGHGFNMKVLRSRPVKENPWEYYFYVEAVGDESSGDITQMLSQLEKSCKKLRVVGCYSNDITLKGDDENDY